MVDPVPATEPAQANPDTLPVPADGKETVAIARAAGILALGNVVSRLLGLVRETVMSHFFGAGITVDAYGVATFVPRMLYDLLIGGMVNGALVPVFSAYAGESREELWRLVSAFLNATVVILAIVIAAIELGAADIAFLMLSADAGIETRVLAARLLRITVPAVLFLSISGALSGLLYALRRFAYPAFTAAVFNAGIVVMAILFHRQLDVAAMAFGLLAGSILQVILQLPGLRNVGLRASLRLWHPGLRRVALLYAPSLIPLVVDMVSRFISLRLASQTGSGGISYLNYATYLTQLPQGLVATAISLAVLPTLSAQSASEVLNTASADAFKSTLARGLRLVIVLIVPATVGLFILADPTVALLYEHGERFLQQDTLMTAWALRFYLLGLPFAAVDLLLVFTFYARQDTLTPALIGVGSIVAYLLLAAGLLPTWGLFSLMIADSFKHLLHTLLSALILWRRLGGFGNHRLWRTTAIVGGAAILMGGLAGGSLWALETLTPDLGGVSELLAVLIPGVLGAGGYLAAISAAGLEEFRDVWQALRRRITAA
jgi:putative peptidoglycan lipid II flippase